MEKSILMNVSYDIKDKKVSYDDGIEHEIIYWTDKIEKTDYCIMKKELNAYLNGSVYSSKVWLLQKKGTYFIATMREFVKGVSYIYDVDKRIIGVMFHDDLKHIWRNTGGVRK